MSAILALIQGEFFNLILSFNVSEALYLQGISYLMRKILICELNYLRIEAFRNCHLMYNN